MCTDTRLEEIAGLEDGWLDGEGTAINRSALTSAQELVDALGELREAFSIFPSVERSGIIFEHYEKDRLVHIDVFSEEDGSVLFVGYAALFSGEDALVPSREEEETFTKPDESAFFAREWIRDLRPSTTR